MKVPPPPRESPPHARATRRQFVAGGSVLLAAGVAGAAFAGDDDGTARGVGGERESEPARDGAGVRIGILTDLHYADKAPAGTRHYRESEEKLREAVALFKEQKPDFLIELGDLVDAAPTVAEELGYLGTIDRVFKAAGLPVHYVLGNHCVTTLTKAEFLKATGARASYYSFDAGGVHFVVLDACFNTDMDPYGRNNFVWTDTNIPPEELAWLKSDLAGTQSPVVVFAHQRLDLEPDAAYAVKQSPEVRKILEDSGKVRAVLQGHSHENALHTLNGIAYCTLAAMVEGSGPANSAYGMLEVTAAGRVTLTGYRRQVNQTLSES